MTATPDTAAGIGGRVQWAASIVFGLALASAAGLLVAESGRMAVLVVIGALLGFALYRGAFGFTGAYRRAIVAGDMSGPRAQIAMLALAVVLFAPVLASGEGLGLRPAGALAPADLRLVVGAFMFGIGMQVAGACASGTLFTAGGGGIRMAVTLAAFCAGGFLATLHLGFWTALPGLGVVALDRVLGWGPGVAVVLLVLGAAWLALGRISKPGAAKGEDIEGFSLSRMLRGPWPLLIAAAALAVFNFLTLLVAGHPWVITWGLTLWAAKAAAALGWDPASAPFWASGFPAHALAAPLWHDTTSVMNAALIAGAGLAAALAGRFRPELPIGPGALARALAGGLLLGYGARLAYGCNIGAFFSGVASMSLHGWIWIAAALAGNWCALRLGALVSLARGAPRRPGE